MPSSSSPAASVPPSPAIGHPAASAGFDPGSSWQTETGNFAAQASILSISMGDGAESLGIQPETRDDDGDDGGRLSLEERQQLLLKHLGVGGPQATRALMEALGWKRSTTRNVLESLLDQGRIRSLAESARSPHQVYEVV